ncbi:MAG: leucyl aminopeptidase family protein [Pseudomonadota bacterium]
MNQTSANIPIFLISQSDFSNKYANSKNADGDIMAAHRFTGQSGKVLIVPKNTGKPKKIFLGIGEVFTPQILGCLAKNLPQGNYEIKTKIKPEHAQNAYLFFLLGRYSFDKYKSTKATKETVNLLPPKNVDAEVAKLVATAIAAGRDLINTPANDMGPVEITNAAITVAKQNNAEIEIIKGDELLTQNYPLIHAVGRAASQEPRLLILRKPKANAPKIGIVGKGVAFDTGGLNLKQGNFMGLMKKDMGGAACAICLFDILAQMDLNLDLNLYLPLVENAVSANSMRPSDIVKARNGMFVEIDNTDAEGRLVLADALTRASEDGMATIFDFATLTGAARVALGPDLPPFYTQNNGLARELEIASHKVQDPIWRMPLWANYSDDLESQIADLKNGGGQFAGSITAALFLAKFVTAKEWVHFDVYCWNPKDKPARPMGGEVQAIRAVLQLLTKRYPKRQQ